MTSAGSRHRRHAVAAAALALALVVGFLLLGKLRAEEPEVEGAVPPSAPAPARQVELLDFGATCDGVQDDRPAIVAAIEHLDSSGGGTLSIPNRTCAVVQTAESVFVRVPSRITLSGAGPKSTISLGCRTSGSYAELFRADGAAITLQGLRLTRGADCEGALLAVDSVTDLSVSAVTFDGESERYDSYMHGILLRGTNGPTHRITLDRVTLTDLDYGLLQPSNVSDSVHDIVVRRSTFARNFADDLEFNAPEGTMTGVRVEDSAFRDNLADSEGAGFGIGLANVQDALIRGNSFSGYGFEPIHIEDRSAQVTIQDNRFESSYLREQDWASHIFIVNDSHDVTITDNVFDTRDNQNRVHAVFVGRGGTGLPEPSGIVIKDNVFLPGPYAGMLSAEGVDGVELSNTDERS